MLAGELISGLIISACAISIFKGNSFHNLPQWRQIKIRLIWLYGVNFKDPMTAEQPHGVVDRRKVSFRHCPNCPFQCVLGTVMTGCVPFRGSER